MYPDRAVLIPKVKGITYKKKGGGTYVVYETGRKYDPENQYNIPERIQIGIQIPAEPDMMLPNENYLKYFFEEMEKTGGKGKDLMNRYFRKRF